MSTRRSLLAPLFATALLPIAVPARAFRVEQADGETNALLAARTEACTAGTLHEDLRQRLAAAIAEADEETAITMLRATLGQCPYCGCGLAQLLPGENARF
ncbi:hypothetical protein [Elioraea sp.]|uniref:hypothetical protein n=1 Tax=Elioraea sp. TaxID=2185103 RepID=UPI0025C2AC27|nr:hypothetical protein [Elioraea sp.]